MPYTLRRKPLRIVDAPPEVAALPTEGDAAVPSLPPVRSRSGRVLREVRSEARLEMSRGLRSTLDPLDALLAPSGPEIRPPSGSRANLDALSSANSFEAVLRVYYRNLASSELEAMLMLCEPILTEAVRKQWICDLKARCHEQIRTAFFMADDDGSGGLSLEEFSSAVALHRGEAALGGTSNAASAFSASASINAACGGGASSSSAAGSSSNAHVGGGAEEVSAEMRALFLAGDRDGNGVLDEDEFYELVSTSAELRKSFAHILALGSRKRADAKKFEHMLMFDAPYSPASHAIVSPSGKRHRPNLTDLHKLRSSELDHKAPDGTDDVDELGRLERAVAPFREAGGRRATKARVVP